MNFYHQITMCLSFFETMYKFTQSIILHNHFTEHITETFTQSIILKKKPLKSVIVTPNRNLNITKIIIINHLYSDVIISN